MGTPQEAGSEAGLAEGLPTLTVDCDPSLSVKKGSVGTPGPRPGVDGWGRTETKSCEERKPSKRENEREKIKRA